MGHRYEVSAWLSVILVRQQVTIAGWLKHVATPGDITDFYRQQCGTPAGTLITEIAGRMRAAIRKYVRTASASHVLMVMTSGLQHQTARTR